ncbi:Cleavage and polyadenylation specificity factor subunit 3 [Xenotaenia resolanae]|uniref:Cleavage and polyadenylation specificity factor subunit 3 n=1 Tax=Xenotaenia resolanae TaxID=208358 RepID=A0ABV0W554_9TELE
MYSLIFNTFYDHLTDIVNLFELLMLKIRCSPFLFALQHIMSEPEEITTMSGQKLPLKMSVDYISFSAHTDYQQTSEFIRALKPPHVILVHGEQNEMARLKAALIREYEDNDQVHIEVHNPRNTEAVTLNFRGEKLAKVLGLCLAASE